MMISKQISKNPSLAHNKILDRICSPLKPIGVNFFGYTAIDASGNAFCLGSKPEYAAEYLRHNHAKNDIHCHPNKVIKKYHYDFWDFLEKDEQANELYQMAACFDQGHTLTISQYTSDKTHCFHFSGSLTDTGINQRFLEKTDSLHAFITYFKDCLATIPELAVVYELPININPTRITQKKKITAIASDPRQLELDVDMKNTVYFKHQFHYFLTDKERECLKWLRQGKSITLIAEINGVSSKTIERYIESCKKKYRCYTLFQLGEKISSSGLSSFIDLSIPF